MKKLKFSVFSITLLTASVTFAAGIPVVDVTSIAQMVTNATQQAEQAATALAQAKLEAEAEKLRFEGNSNLNSLISQVDLDKYISSTDWTSSSTSSTVSSKSSTSITELRKTYGLTSDNATVQKYYDVELTNLGNLQTAFDGITTKISNIKELASYASSATTPQEKQDYANKIATELTYIQANSTQIQTQVALMNQNRILREQANSKSFYEELEEK